jgi:hypothetical protein
MAVSCSINADNTTPGHGDTLTVTYVVDGNDPIDPAGATISGRAVVGGVPYDVTTTVTIPGSPAEGEVFDVPTCPDLPGFTVTSNPAVFTTSVP